MNTFASQREQALERALHRLMQDVNFSFSSRRLRKGALLGAALMEARDALELHPTTACELRDLLGDACGECVGGPGPVCQASRGATDQLASDRDGGRERPAGVRGHERTRRPAA